MYDYEGLEELQEARQKKGLSYEQLGELVGHNAMWVASALNGQQHVPPEEAAKFAEALGVSPKDVEVLTQPLLKATPTPVIYRPAGNRRCLRSQPQRSHSRKIRQRDHERHRLHN